MNHAHPTPACPAKSMSIHRKKKIAIEALSKSKTQTRISEENGVSRKFVRKHRDGAKAAVNDHFCESDEAILFTIDVTDAWIGVSQDRCHA